MVGRDGPGAYREDGDDDPHGAEHRIVYRLTRFQRILDALVVAVKPPVVRLDGACLNDEEGQTSWRDGTTTYTRKKQERGNISAKRPKKNDLQQRPSHNMDRKMNSLHLQSSATYRKLSLLQPLSPSITLLSSPRS